MFYAAEKGLYAVGALITLVLIIAQIASTGGW